MDGNMRRLPPWMLAGASSNRKDEKSRKRKHEPEAPKKKAEKRPRRTVKVEERDGSEEPKKVEIIQSVSGPEEEEDLTVDDLLSFAQEYVKGVEDETRKKRESLSASESDMRSSQGETNGTRDTTSDDMFALLLGPLFKKSQR